MGWWSGVWEGVKRFGSTVAKIAHKAWEFATGPSAKSAYDDLEKVLEKYNKVKTHVSGSDDTPDFFGGLSVGQVDKKLDDYERKLATQQNELTHARKYMAVQTEFSRLRVSAELIDRSMANIKIHASSLSTHFQNIRNINGLNDDVNALRGGLKLLMKTFNHNMNVLGAQSEDSKLIKIEGVDVDLKEGAVSMLAAFDAFDRTRQLLSEEIVELSNLAKSHTAELENLKVNAGTLDGEVGVQVINFIDSRIKPIISRAEKASYLLQGELKNLPSASRDENGRLIFENGKLKIDNEPFEQI
ncbi:hypothetical protein [Methylotuvimicrobium sp. KM1]|uniref:hypothetical protein n=1 Tax=Methylotuvimicrobium sp. KM1 TaxID=3377707 RepID=UPI00384BE6EB